MSSPVRLSSAFRATARQVLCLVQERLGLEVCLLSVKHGDDYVVVEAVDRLLGLELGAHGMWRDSACHVMAERLGPAIVPDLASVASYDQAVELSGVPMRAYAGVALRRRDGSLLGSLCGLSLTPRSEDLLGQQGLLDTLGALLSDILDRELRAATALAAAELASEQARTDDLTGLLNLRGWRDALDREADVPGPVTVLLIDLDELKAVNDSQGHSAGDALIRRAASLLSDWAAGMVLGKVLEDGPALTDPTWTPVRRRCSVARIGGDEFAVLLRETADTDAPDLAHVCQRALHDAGVNASIGWAVRRTGRGIPLALKDADELMRADKARRRTERRRQAPSRSHRPLPLPRSVSGLETDQDVDQDVQELLRQVRNLFGLEAAFVSRLTEEDQEFTHLDTDGPFAVSVGDRRPLAVTLCRRVLDGELPRVITDATHHAASRDVDVVVAGLVRTYLTVPLRLPDGDLYGTLCCLSSSPRPDLTSDAAAALEFAARHVGVLLGRKRDLATAELVLTRRLDALLTTDGLRIALQPVVDLRDGTTIGHEALARFSDGTEPEDWFQQARDHGVGERLELTAIELALLPEPADDGSFLAINVSPTIVMIPAFQQLLQALQPERLERLVLELTEHEHVTDYAGLAACLAVWRRRGVRVAIDDTGAGHSSLMHVLRVAPDIIKLDRQMITDVDTDPVRLGLVHRLQQFCSDAAISLIAEGVETAAEAAALAGVGVVLAQGFHLGRPRTSEAVLVT